MEDNVTAENEIIIEAGNPFDFDEKHLVPLIAEVQAETGLPTRAAFRKEEAYGVSLYEVIFVWIPKGYALARVLQPIIKFARNRFRRDKEQHPESPRPRSITILGPDGRPLKSVVIRSPDAEPEERTEKERDDMPARERPR
jgi:hypothetical protein